MDDVADQVVNSRRRSGRTEHRAAVLPSTLRTGLIVVAALAALVVVGLGVLYAGSGGEGPTDDLRGPWQSLALAADWLGQPTGSVLLVAAVVLLCLALRRPRAAALAVAGVGATVATTTLLKHVVGRTIHGGNLSYPSGHTAFATAVALVVALAVADRLGLDRPAGMTLVLGAAGAAGAAMGWAEVGLGAHYPTDAVGGWCSALVVIPVTAWAVDRVADALTRGAGR